MLLQALRRQEQALRRLGQGRRSWGLAQRIPGRGRRSCRQQGLRIRHRQLTRRSFPGEGWRGWRLKEKEHVMSVLGGGALLLCWLSGLKLTNRGQPGGHGPAGCLPCWLVGPLTFQKGDLAQQQPVYQGRVGDGRQGDGTEAGAKEGLWLRVRCRLAIDCDGQGCEEEKRDLGRLGLAGCPFFVLLQKGLFWGFEGPLFASITNTLCCLGGEGQQAQQAGGQKKHKFTFLVLAFFSLL